MSIPPDVKTRDYPFGGKCFLSSRLNGVFHIYSRASGQGPVRQGAALRVNIVGTQPLLTICSFLDKPVPSARGFVLVLKTSIIYLT